MEGRRKKLYGPGNSREARNRGQRGRVPFYPILVSNASSCRQVKWKSAKLLWSLTSSVLSKTPISLDLKAVFPSNLWQKPGLVTA